jgi:hypothetical protein
MPLPGGDEPGCPEGCRFLDGVVCYCDGASVPFLPPAERDRLVTPVGVVAVLADWYRQLPDADGGKLERSPMTSTDAFGETDEGGRRHAR